jgi:hypothetical protein
VLNTIVERVEKVWLATIIEKNVFRGDINVLKKFIVLSVNIVLANVRPIDETVEYAVGVPLTVLRKFTVLKNEFTTAGDTTGILDVKIIVLKTGDVLPFILNKFTVLCVVEVNEIKFV